MHQKHLHGATALLESDDAAEATDYAAAVSNSNIWSLQLSIRHFHTRMRRRFYIYRYLATTHAKQLIK